MLRNNPELIVYAAFLVSGIALAALLTIVQAARVRRSKSPRPHGRTIVLTYAAADQLAGMLDGSRSFSTRPGFESQHVGDDGARLAALQTLVTEKKRRNDEHS